MKLMQIVEVNNILRQVGAEVAGGAELAGR